MDLYKNVDKALKGRTHIFMPVLQHQESRVRSLGSPMRGLTLVYDRGGLSEKTFNRYCSEHFDKLQVPPQRVLVPRPQHLGVLAGLPWDTLAFFALFF